MIVVEHVGKSFGTELALADVSLSLEPGRTTALIGPSGCGKSTLLRVMMGLIEPDRGEVRFDGERVGRDNARALRKRCGYAIQSGGLFPHMTAWENIALPARLARWRSDRTQERVLELAGLMDLPEDALGRFPAELSGGQRQRVALSRSLMLDPEVLLLDEPLGALDPIIRSHLQRELGALFAELRKTVVLVTHDLAEAATLAPDDIVLLREGTIEQRGAFETLRKDPTSEFAGRFVADQVDRVEALIGGGA